MADREYKTKADVLKRAIELADAKIPFAELDKGNRLSEKNKGDLGQIIEESWFNYHPNSDPTPDFEEAGVELKVSPYRELQDGRKSAKERLVCDIINYMEEVGKTFETSAFWVKCQSICLLSYLWRENKPKGEMYVDHAILFEYPEEDLLIIRQDWQTIITKIRQGLAHELSEGDTLYLAACTKGSSSKDVRQQPYSNIPAKQRAYSLKTTYMTHVLRRFVFGDETSERVIKDWHILEKVQFEEAIRQMFIPYYGKTSVQILQGFGLKVSPSYRSINGLATKKILGLVGDVDKVAEFQNANISVKTICVNAYGTPEQSMQFPPFNFMDLINQEWEDSDVYQQMVAAKFLFVVFTRNSKTESAVLKDAFFWNMPPEDIEELHSVWLKTIEAINEGAGLVREDGKVYNSLPGQADSDVAHVRPHSRKAAYILEDGTIIGEPEKYANKLPTGAWMTNQSFWFNKSYIRKIIRSRTYFIDDSDNVGQDGQGEKFSVYE